MMSYKDRKIIFLVQDIPEKTCVKVFFKASVGYMHIVNEPRAGIYPIADKTGRLPSSGL